MIVNYFNVQRIAVFPAKADSPLIVDPYTVLSLAVAFQGFKTVLGLQWDYRVGPSIYADTQLINAIGQLFSTLRPYFSGIF